MISTSAAAQFRFDSWTTDDGLPQNSVYSIAQTADGYLWFTTLDGLVRFDGVKFKVFNKSNSPNFFSNRLQVVFADGDRLWIAPENGGLVRYSNGEFRVFSAADGLPSNNVNDIQRDADGSLLIFMADGIARTRDGGASFAVERRDDFNNYRVYHAASGARFELTKNGLQVRRPHGVAERYELPFDSRKIAEDRFFNVFTYIPVFENRDQTFWFAAAGNLYRLQNGAITAFTKENGMPRSRVRTIAADAAGDIWFGTEKDGACRLSAEKIACFGISNGLSSNHVMTIFLDRENTLWIGTNEAGLNRAAKQIVAPLSVAHGLFNKNVYPILQARSGDFWIGTTTALSHVKNGEIKNHTETDGLIYSVVQSLFEDRDGRLWIGSVGGIELLENGEFVDLRQAFQPPQISSNFWDIHQTADGTMWFGTSDGLYRYENGVATKIPLKNTAGGEDVISMLETKDGSLWLATLDGVARLKDNQITKLTEKDGLAGNFVRSIYEDTDGFLWFGTYDSGLSLSRQGKFTTFNTNNGLFSNGVFAILPDERGNLWMSSNQGIYRVNRRQLLDYADGKISLIVSTAFNKSDGMLNVECNGGRQPAGIKTTDGKLWFATQDGVAIVDPNAVAFNSLAPPVVIENVTVENDSIADFQTAIEIQPDQNNLEIEYTGLSFVKPEQVRFRYKLEGLDADWTEAGARRTAFYPYLPPGDYTFRVTAANSDNVWNEEGASVSLKVLPPFYRTWWFYAATMLGLAGAGISFFRLRIQQIERRHHAEQAFSRRLIESQEQERKRIAAEMHDGLGQSLVIIKNRARLGLKQAESKTAMLDHLENISATASQAIEETREIAFNLRPHLLDRLGLTQTIDSMLEKVFGANEIKLETRIESIDDLLPKEAEILFFRVVQEFASNIVKHSGASKVSIQIERGEHSLRMEISDDGKGFEQTADNSNGTRGGFGLIGTAERIRLLGGNLQIDSQINRGTNIIVEIDLKK